MWIILLSSIHCIYFNLRSLFISWIQNIRTLINNKIVLGKKIYVENFYLQNQT
jgi:hypothetical protein